MNKLKANATDLIEELIEISNTKYGYIKVGRDTLNLDILFIENYEKLKDFLGTTSLEDFDYSELPRMKTLKNIVEKINAFNNDLKERNIKMSKAAKAYKK
jgi:hypothetical protein